MAYKMMHTLGKIKLNGGIVINQKGTQFTIEDKATRDILIENKNAIDITDGMPATQQTDKDVLLIQLQVKDDEINKLSKQIAELRQVLKNANLDVAIEDEKIEEVETKAKKGGGK